MSVFILLFGGAGALLCEPLLRGPHVAHVLPNVADCVTIREGIFGINRDLTILRDITRAFDGWDDSTLTCYRALF